MRGKESGHKVAEAGPGAQRQELGPVSLKAQVLIRAESSCCMLAFQNAAYESQNCSFPAGIVEIQTLSSLFILLKTTFGLKILFAIDGERIYIQLTSAWKRRTLGLCGTFNGNIRDDFL